MSLELGQAARLPDQMTDQEFWRIVTGFSEVRNVSSRTYQAIVRSTCRGCSASRVSSTAVNVAVGDKDVTDLRLPFIAQ